MKKVHLTLSQKEANYVAPYCELLDTDVSDDVLKTSGTAGDYNSDDDYYYDEDF